MKVKELIEILKQLNQEYEIRYDSYEFVGNFKIEEIETVRDKNSGVEYYNIV